MSDDEFRAAMSEITELIIDYKREMRTVPPNIPVGNVQSHNENMITLDLDTDNDTESVTTTTKKTSELSAGDKNALLLKDIRDQVIPRMTHWDSVNFYAWFNTIIDYSAVIGATLSSALGTIPFTYRSNPASTELEMTCMDYFADVFGIPARFKHASQLGGGGCIQNSASNACLVSMFAAKQRILAQMFQELDEETRQNTTLNQLADKLVCYISDQTHMSVEKAASILGIPNIRRVPTNADTAFSIRDGKELSRLMNEDIKAGLRPFFLCLTIGTTSSGGVDQSGTILKDLKSANLIDTSNGVQLWTHLDGAYGLCYGCLSDEMNDEQKKEFGLDGLDMVDSITLNGPKALMQSFPLSLYWVRQYSWLNQALKMDPSKQEYLIDRSSGNSLNNNSAENIDFKEWQTELGRAFGSVKLLSLARLVGKDGLKCHMRYRLKSADYLESMLSEDEWWANRVELAVKPSMRKLGFVCFRFIDLDHDTHLKLLDKINQSGQVFLIHTVLDGKICFRVAVGGSETIDVIPQTGNGSKTAAETTADDRGSFTSLNHLLNTVKQTVIDMGLDTIPLSK